MFQTTNQFMYCQYIPRSPVEPWREPPYLDTSKMFKLQRRTRTKPSSFQIPDAK